MGGDSLPGCCLPQSAQFGARPHGHVLPFLLPCPALHHTRHPVPCSALHTVPCGHAYSSLPPTMSCSMLCTTPPDVLLPLSLPPHPTARSTPCLMATSLPPCPAACPMLRPTAVPLPPSFLLLPAPCHCCGGCWVIAVLLHASSMPPSWEVAWAGAVGGGGGDPWGETRSRWGAARQDWGERGEWA